jgi:eukaryotic-like serine/threonine-protein kinase
MPSIQQGACAPSLSNGKADQSSSQNRLLPTGNGLAHGGTDEPNTTDDPKATQQVFVDAKFRISDLPPGIVPLPRIDGYEILGVLGRGGMGVVYKAREIKLERIVALKMILAGAHASPVELQRFQTEARAVAQLQHPNIVQIHDINHQDCQHYFSLEYVDGDNLARKINSTPQSPRRAAQLVEVLARAMFCAHERNIVHRDLKPGNILLTADGIPKITDFGVAKQLDSDQGNTKSGAIVGTPSYMAPEQARGEGRRMGPAVDIYSLGVILYEMLTGRPPFKADNPMDILFQVARDDPPPPSRLQPKVPRDLEIICLKCLEKDPNRRYLTAQALANDLARFLADEPILARPLSGWERSWRWVKRHKAATAVAAAVILGVAGIAGGVGLSLNTEHHRLDGKVTDARFTVNDDKTWENTPAILDDIASQINSQPALEALWPSKQGELESIKTRYAGRVFHRDVTQAHEHIMPRVIQVLRGPSDNELAKEIQREAWKTLTYAGFSPKEKTNSFETLDLTTTERHEVEHACYELILLLAEFQRGQQALAILDLAEPLAAKSPSYFIRRAEYLIQAGHPQEAKRERERAAHSQLTAFDHYLMGEAHYQQGKEKLATEEFVRALQMKPDHFWARYFMSVCHINLGQPALARDNLTVCVKEKPEIIWTYLMRGYAEGKLGEYAAAEADFNTVFKMTSDPDTLYVLYNNRGVMRIEQEDRLTEGMQDLQEAVRNDSKKYNAYASLADAYARQKNWNESLRHIDLAIAKADNPATKGALYRYRARYHSELQDDAAALADLDKEIAMESEAGVLPAKAYVLRGRLLSKNRRFDEALKSYEAAQQVLPGFPEVIRGRAETLYQNKRYPEAIQAFNDLFKTTAQATAQDYRARGFARAMSSDSQGAAEDYSRALELENKTTDSEKKTANVAWLLTHRGQAYLTCQADRPALHDFDEALRLDSKNREAFGSRGLARVRLGQIDAGVQDARKALSLEPPTARVCYDAARVYAQAAAAVDAHEPRARQNKDKKVEYQNQALDLIRQALELLPASQRNSFWQDTVRKDACLAPICRMQAFSRLEEKYAPKISAGLTASTVK